MSVRDEIGAYVIDGADEAKRMGHLLAQHDWPRLPEADETLAAAHRAYDHAGRSVKRQVNRASYVAAFAVAHLETLIALDEGRERRERHTRFHRGQR